MIDQINVLREDGLKFHEIGEKLGISGSFCSRIAKHPDLFLNRGSKSKTRPKDVAMINGYPVRNKRLAAAIIKVMRTYKKWHGYEQLAIDIREFGLNLGEGSIRHCLTDLRKAGIVGINQKLARNGGSEWFLVGVGRTKNSDYIQSIDTQALFTPFGHTKAGKTGLKCIDCGCYFTSANGGPVTCNHCRRRRVRKGDYLFPVSKFAERG
jgi:DNA-directed RNA polymerase subunit RPC12/RpoP